jgi:hypothetical protein
MRQGHATAATFEAVNLAPGEHSCTRFAQPRDEHACDGGEVDDAGLRGVQRRHAAGVRLELAELHWPQAAKALDSVSSPPGLELLQSRQLGLAGCHDQLPAALVRDLVLVAERVYATHSLDAQACLERPWLVVDTGVHDA